MGITAAYFLHWIKGRYYLQFADIFLQFSLTLLFHLKFPCKYHGKPVCDFFTLILFNQGSPDLIAAKEVADYLKTRHHEFYFTVQVILDTI